MLARNLVVFPGSRRQSRDWSPQELAEFYRVEGALLQAGMRIDTDRGLSDEGDPWFVFCREDDGEPVVHFARIDGQYVIASPAYDSLARGGDFRTMVKDLIERHRLTQETASAGGNVHIHPAALLLLVVGAAFFKTPSDAQAATPAGTQSGDDAAQKKGGGARLFSEAFNATVTQVLASQSDWAQIESGAQLQIAAAALLVAGAPAQAEAAPDPAAPSLAGDARLDALPKFPPVDDAGDETGAIPLIDFQSLAAAPMMEPQTMFAAPETLDLRLDDHVWTSSLLSAGASGKLPAAELTNAPGAADPAFVMSKLSAGQILAAPAQASAPQAPPELGEAAPARAQTPAAQTAATPAPPAPEAAPDHAAGIHEEATELAAMPATLAYVPAHASVAAHTGTASAFLAQNKIFLSSRPQGDRQIAVAESPEPESPPPAVADAPAETAPGVGKSPPLMAQSPGVVISDHSASAMPNVLSGAEFLRTLTLFLSETPHTVIRTLQEQYVFFGPQSGPEGFTALERMTMTFEDGSSISIVGQTSALKEIVADVL